MPHETRRTFVKRVGAAASSGLIFGAGSGATNAAESETGQVRFERSIPVARAYDVVVSSKLLSQFSNTKHDLKYYIALEPDSTFG